MDQAILPGRAAPLGATADSDGTNFAVSSRGDEVVLCLFDRDGTETQLVLPDGERAMLVDGLVTLALGALILGWPKISILAAATLLGIYLLVSGVAEIIFALSLHASIPSRVLLFVTGALSVVLGVLSIRHFGEGYAVLLLAIWIGIGKKVEKRVSEVLESAPKEWPERPCGRGGLRYSSSRMFALT